VAPYRLLLTNGTPAKVDHPPATAALAGLVASLPAELRDPAAKLLAGHRLAQEAIGYKGCARLSATLLG
jgi:hypothetical protein